MNDNNGDMADTVTVQVNGTSSVNGSEGPAAAPTQPPNNADVPKPKRLACMICRKRKLRCDGNRPRCSTCMRLGHDCAYDEVRRKSGPKRGYVKALEERLSASTPLFSPGASVPACPLLARASLSALADPDEMQSKSRRYSRPRIHRPLPRPLPTMGRSSAAAPIQRATRRRP